MLGPVRATFSSAVSSHGGGPYEASNVVSASNETTKGEDSYVRQCGKPMCISPNLVGSHNYVMESDLLFVITLWWTCDRKSYRSIAAVVLV
jgi:hypothetical protein